MLEFIFYNWKNISKIILITIIIICIQAYLIATELKGYILDNWRYFRKKPYIMLIAGFIKRDKNESVFKASMKNFVNIIWSIVKKFISLLIKPFYPVLKLITNILDYYKGVIDNLRAQFKIMRNFLFTMIRKINIRLQNGIAAITYFFLKLRDGLKKQLALYRMLSWTMAHSYYFLSSLVRGPVGKLGQFAETFGLAASFFTLGIPGVGLWMTSVCFDPTTKIMLKNGVEKSIIDITIEDTLRDKSYVEAVCIFNIESNIIPMFNYKNIVVSGDHVVLEDGNYIRIKESKYSKPIFYNKDTLCCLVTNTGFIEINKILFCDFLDTHDIEANHDVHRFIEVAVNSINIPYRTNILRPPDLLWGFGNYNLIDTGNEYKYMGDLKIGDSIYNDKITGIINIRKQAITEYKYMTNDNKYVYVSGNQLVKEGNEWLRVYQSENSVLILNSIHTFYIHFTTESNEFICNNSIFKDFIETNDVRTNNIIDTIVDVHLDKLTL